MGPIPLLEGHGRRYSTSSEARPAKQPPTGFGAANETHGELGQPAPFGEACPGVMGDLPGPPLSADKLVLLGAYGPGFAPVPQGFLRGQAGTAIPSRAPEVKEKSLSRV